MASIRYDKDADLSIIQSKKVAVIGYGSQGHAHALNLKESGVDVCVGLHANSKSRGKAEKDGLVVKAVRDAADWADVMMVLAPDTSQAAIYQEHIAPTLKKGKTLMFAHGFNIRFETIKPPAEIDVSMTPARITPIPFAYDNVSARARPVASWWMANNAGVPAPSTNSSRTRWPGDFGATIDTSTSGRTVTVPKRMLKPWANITILPGARLGAISSV